MPKRGPRSQAAKDRRALRGQQAREDSALIRSGEASVGEAKALLAGVEQQAQATSNQSAAGSTALTGKKTGVEAGSPAPTKEEKPEVKTAERR